MSDIINATGAPVGKIDNEGWVYVPSQVHPIGRVLEDGEVFDAKNSKVGVLQSNGYVLNYTGSHAGTVYTDSRGVRDYNDHYIGKVVGDHIEKGGAALILLIR